MSAFKRRRLGSRGEECEVKVQELRSVSVMPSGPRGGASGGPRVMIGGRGSGAPRVGEGFCMPRAY